MTTQLRLICQFQNVLDNPRNSIEVPGPVCVLPLDSESQDSYVPSHRTVRIESDPLNDKPLEVCPVSEAEVSPHFIPMSISIAPSPLTSRTAKFTGTASAPVAPKRTVFGSTVAASNPLPVRIATRISLSLLGLILFASPRGLMSTITSGVTLTIDARARSAWIKPNPRSKSTPGGPLRLAVVSRISYTLAGSMVGTACNIRAATAAACGAAADVPKKFGKPSGSTSRLPKNVVLAPSGATISGFTRICGIAKRLPAVSKMIGVDPAEENGSRSGGETPNSGVLR